MSVSNERIRVPRVIFLCRPPYIHFSPAIFLPLIPAEPHLLLPEAHHFLVLFARLFATWRPVPDPEDLLEDLLFASLEESPFRTLSCSFRRPGVLCNLGS